MQSFKTLLDPRILTASYAQRDGARAYLLTDFFFTNPRNIEGHEFELIYYPAMMEPAPGNVPGGEARVLTPGGGTTRKAALFTNFNKILLPGEALNALREPDSLTLQQQGATTVSRIYDDFAERHNLFKEVVIAKTLTAGVVYLNAEGQVLESSTGATITADFGVPAAHKGNLGGIIADLWSTASTKIADHIDAIRDQAEAENVEPPTDIWLHPNNKAALRNNTQFGDWAKYNNVATDAVLRGDIIENLWGLNWHFYGGKYQAVDGTMKNFLPTTGAILSPPPNRPWLRATQGSTLVPSQIGVVEHWQDALQSTNKFYGKYSYARLHDDPMALYLYMGDKFGLHFADPAAIWMPTLFA
jgi:hypothetical protein